MGPNFVKICFHWTSQNLMGFFWRRRWGSVCEEKSDFIKKQAVFLWKAIGARRGSPYGIQNVFLWGKGSWYYKENDGVFPLE